MVKKSRPATKPASNSRRSDGNGNRIQNRILLGLSRKEYDMLFSKLEFVRLSVHQVLHEAGDITKFRLLHQCGRSVRSGGATGRQIRRG
jgi:hypothetical protein